MRGTRGAVVLFFCLAVSAAGLVAAQREEDFLKLALTSPADAFSEWNALHQKPYHPKHSLYKDKLATFQRNAAFVNSHNQASDSSKMYLNEFADLTWEEFASTKLGLNIDLKKNSTTSNGFSHSSVTAPPEVDWRTKGVVTNVKNQGMCGSCWAFATTGAVEGVNAIKTGKLTVVSEGELVDCDREKNMGCGGGLMDYAFNFIIKNGGLDTAKDYPYWGNWEVVSWCNSRKEKDRTVVTIDGYEDVPENDESALKKAVSQQPVAVGICASPSMQFYHSGIIDNCCLGLNHGVLAVGYGDDDAGGSYWIVKNSWGEGWGEEGYFRLKYGVGKGGLCGIASTASYPLKTHDNPRVPHMCDALGWSECPSDHTCSCALSFPFNLFCLRHDCCPLSKASSCSDNKHCCPSDMPVCDVEGGMCVSKDGTKSVAWTNKVAPGSVTSPMSQGAEGNSGAMKKDTSPRRAMPTIS